MVDSKAKDILFLTSGVAGGFVLLFGLSQNASQLYYVIGSLLLLLTSVHFRLIYFIALELILISGHGANLLHFNTSIQLALPILLSSQLLFFYLFSGQLNNFFLFIGILGIALLSIGFAYANQCVFFFGGLSIAIYAFYTTYRGKSITLLWAVLNTLFALIAIYNLIIDYW